MADKITGGYYIKARKIQQSDIMRMAPCAREVWDWMLCNADHRTGQLLVTQNEVREALSWQVGWSKKMYSIDQIKSAYEALTKAQRIHLRKTPRKTVVTIINYLYYQDKNNYASPPPKPPRKTVGSPNEAPNDKTIQNTEIIITKALDDFEKMRKAIRKPLTPRARELILQSVQKMYPSDIALQVACLEQSIANSWQGVFELKEQPRRELANPGKVRF